MDIGEFEKRMDDALDEGKHLQGGLNACSRLRRMATITHT